jgi:hypothetical protein
MYHVAARSLACPTMINENSIYYCLELYSDLGIRVFQVTQRQALIEVEYVYKVMKSTRKNT